MNDRLTIEEFSEHFVEIPELDFFGQWARSPNGRFLVVWRDGNDEGTHGGFRESGPGRVLLLDDDCLVADVRAERPNTGHVADNGRFIVNDWRFGDGLKGRFLAFDSDGSKVLSHDLEADLLNNGLSADGRLAVCQTANAPGEHGSKLFLFDLEDASLLASFNPEQGWATDYGFDPAGEWIELRYADGSTVRYGRDGAMLDREGWLEERVARGDIRVIAQLVEEMGEGLTMDQATPLIAGLETAIAGDEWHSQARGHRFKGEIFERIGRDEDALGSYDAALLLDPQIGSQRRADRLRRKLAPAGAKQAKGRPGRFERHTQTLGIEHERIELLAGETKQWRLAAHLPYSGVEAAALCHYEASGWSGCASEGGLILTLLKAASFKPSARETPTPLSRPSTPKMSHLKRIGSLRMR